MGVIARIKDLLLSRRNTIEIESIEGDISPFIPQSFKNTDLYLHIFKRDNRPICAIVSTRKMSYPLRVETGSLSISIDMNFDNFLATYVSGVVVSLGYHDSYQASPIKFTNGQSGRIGLYDLEGNRVLGESSTPQQTVIKL